MKTFLNLAPRTARPFSRAAAFLAVVTFSLSGTSLSAQTVADNANPQNISTEKHGSVVLYSTPLAKGASPDLLINGQPGSLHFSRIKNGTRLIVVDLGRSYKLNTVKLTFAHTTKLKVYVLRSKLADNTSWASLVAGLQPDVILGLSNLPGSFGGVEGQYLVLVPETDPGAFSGLYVTGYPSTDRRDLIGYMDQGHEHDHDSGALGETPLPANEFNEAHEPKVPPQSND